MGSGVAMVAFRTLGVRDARILVAFRMHKKTCRGYPSHGCGMRVLKSVTLIKLHCYLTNDCKSSEVRIIDENEWWYPLQIRGQLTPF